MPPAELHHVLSQVCRALAKAHAAGIVHRDLKPDNIFLVRDDDREIAKVLDFGIAKQQRPELGGGNTKTGAMLGTPFYMSPEQAQGTKTVDLRSDLWSLAVISFQAITGRLPFESDALGDLLIKIMVEEMPVPSRYGWVPPGFDAWWARAASRNPAARFQSAKEFADSLALVCQVSQASGLTDPGSVSRDPLQRPPPPGPMAAPPAGTMTPSPVSRTFSPERTGDRTAGTVERKSRVGLIVALSIATWLLVGGVLFAAYESRHSHASAAAVPALGATAGDTTSPPPVAATAPAAAGPATPATASSTGSTVAAAASTPLAAPLPAPATTGSAPPASTARTSAAAAPGTSRPSGPSGPSGPSKPPPGRAPGSADLGF